MDGICGDSASGECNIPEETVQVRIENRICDTVRSRLYSGFRMAYERNVICSKQVDICTRVCILFGDCNGAAGSVKIKIYGKAADMRRGMCVFYDMSYGISNGMQKGHSGCYAAYDSEYNTAIAEGKCARLEVRGFDIRDLRLPGVEFLLQFQHDEKRLSGKE